MFGQTKALVLEVLGEVAGADRRAQAMYNDISAELIALRREAKYIINKLTQEKGEIMAEINALRDAVVSELATLRSQLTEETDTLRQELEDALQALTGAYVERDDALQAREDALDAFAEYKARVVELTGNINAEGIFGEASVNEDVEPELPLEEPEGDSANEVSGDPFSDNGGVGHDSR